MVERTTATKPKMYLMCINSKGLKQLTTRWRGLQIQSHRRSVRWRQNTKFRPTGLVPQVGLLAEAEGNNVSEYVKKLCPFFYEIEDIIYDRASICPLALSEKID
jgi:hypothetical protein